MQSYKNFNPKILFNKKFGFKNALFHLNKHKKYFLEAI